MNDVLISVAPAIWHIGRVMLASLFVLGGLNKILHYSNTTTQMGDAGISPILLPLVIALELGGGLMVALGGVWAIPLALMLAGYTLVVNLVFHPFWAFTGPMAQTEVSLFFKNLSVTGGLLAVAAALALQRAA